MKFLLHLFYFSDQLTKSIKNLKKRVYSTQIKKNIEFIKQYKRDLLTKNLETVMHSVPKNVPVLDGSNYRLLVYKKPTGIVLDTKYLGMVNYTISMEKKSKEDCFEWYQRIKTN